eukprot:GILI01002864.1.p1 GENE.GILI01002864.1~~GILI01002864.1.p1  ORF type:complete len:218 (-),score=50.64 GILI01002864.1:48-701(-)
MKVSAVFVASLIAVAHLSEFASAERPTEDILTFSSVNDASSKVLVPEEPVKLSFQMRTTTTEPFVLQFRTILLQGCLVIAAIAVICFVFMKTMSAKKAKMSAPSSHQVLSVTSESCDSSSDSSDSESSNESASDKSSKSSGKKSQKKKSQRKAPQLAVQSQNNSVLNLSECSQKESVQPEAELSEKDKRILEEEERFMRSLGWVPESESESPFLEFC